MISGPTRKFLAFAALLVAIAGGGVSSAVAESDPSAERIISGTAADPAAWPSIAAMYYEPPGERGRSFQICGGTVIAPRYVLSAAHCVEGTKAKRMTIVVGRYNLSDRSVGQEIGVKSIKVDPDYRPPFFRGDFSVIELKADAAVTPAVLPSPTQDAAATALGAPVRVAGWGSTKPNGSRASRILLQATETVQPDKACTRFYRQGFKAKEQICTKGDPQPKGGVNGSCYGDSGGPLMADTVAGPLLLGAVSFGGDRCATQPEVYARVSSGLDFIEQASGVVPLSP